jgi:predicted nucleotidyltransferase
VLEINEITKEVAKGLNYRPKPLKVIIFGSFASGIPREDSDIDLVVVLDREGISDTYRTVINNRMEISRRLRDLKRRYPMDILVYTKDEWEVLKASGSSFVDKMEREGISIL